MWRVHCLYWSHADVKVLSKGPHNKPLHLRVFKTYGCLCQPPPPNRIHYLCRSGIEKSVTWYHRYSLPGKARDAKRRFLARDFSLKPSL